MSPSISQAVRVLSAGLVPDFRDGSAGSADCQDMERRKERWAQRREEERREGEKKGWK